ncbi:lipoprotein-releasing ABC transporter permease subunit LolC [Frischella perrara]|uniref:lipoprotein-releasing ABC transporter permease subunit LolC n=1 Tax=Frischella perrara TaxID=1267021 RepID=UPI0023F57F79|nr:lipoprotein-releasing ABC transporter permease subunit LolC [Frischella perrara]
MFYPLPFFIGLRYAYSRKSDSFGRFVSWLSMIGIMLGSFGLIVIMSVMNGFENEMQKNILQFIPQAQITTQTHRLNFIDYPKTVIPNNDHIKHITPLITGDVIIQSPNNITMSTIVGVDPNEFDPITSYIYLGNLSDLKPNEYKVIIGDYLASKLNVGVGDKLRLMVTDASQITPLGKIPSQRLFEVAGIFSVNHDIDQSIIYLNINDAAKLMRYPSNTITSWRLTLDNPLNIQSIVAQPLSNQLQFNDWRDKRGELFQAIRMEKNVMALLISLIVIVAAFNIITSLSLLVMEKQTEIAILKTQGLNRFKTMLIFIIQGASSGIIGSVIGCSIGLIFALSLANFNLTFSGIPLPSIVDSQQVIIVFISLLLLSILSTLYPAYRAASTQPAEALRYE